MFSKITERLANDHVALDQLLKQLQAALNNGDANACYARLDLFWAKLAVHIRAEHLHLFPRVLEAVTRTRESLDEGSHDDTRKVIEQLRADHEFFMHELGKAVIDKELDTVRRAISEIEQKLIEHNRIEENHVYQLAGIVLNTAEQEELVQRISSELEKRPPRFAANVW